MTFYQTDPVISFHNRRGFTSRTYKAWASMRQRCNTPTHADYKNYGGRGITVCDAWSDFRAFLADMGEAPPGMALDRKDNDGLYCKANCRWATPLEQANNRRNNKNLVFNGETHTVRAWARRIGITHHALYSRLRRNWSLQRALSA